MAEDIKALDYSFEEIGKHMKSSKKRYTWKFLAKQATHNIVCDTSVVSNKVKIQVDGKTILQSDLWVLTAFQHKFAIDGHECIIIQEGERFELRIDNKIFLHLLNHQKGKKQFKDHEECVEDISITQKFERNKDQKLNLNISAMDGMKKKKNNVMESENWKGMQSGGEKDIEYFKRNANIDYSMAPTHASQITPSQINIYVPPSQIKCSEEFSTMQMLFSTQNQVPSTQKVQTSILGKKEENNAVKMMEEFNTMQNLFATNMQNCMGIPSQTSPQNEQNGEFSTIQELFATQNPANMLQKTENNENNFSTIQQLFATQAPTQAKTTPDNQKSGIQTTTPLPTDFNTMQSLFKSINPNGQAPQDLHQLFSTISPPENKIQNIPSAQPSPQDFSTLQNLFATQQMPIPNIQQINTSMVKPEDFSTMQNLFATMKIDPSIVQTDMSSSPLADTTNVKAEDFNTMQNLFKTRIGVPSPQNLQNHQSQ